MTKQVSDILANRDRTVFSLEFFPPKLESDTEKLFVAIRELNKYNPAYVSVTYGAGGTTRDRTYNLVLRIQQDTGLPVVAHLTCVGSSRAEIENILDDYTEAGVSNLLALRGDPPRGETWHQQPDGFAYAADLVGFIRQHSAGTSIGVAGFPEGHPDTPNRLQEIEHLKKKVDAGADYIVTQLFFDNRDYFDFCDRCEIAGITIPIVAGILPITTKHGMIRMAELAGGARLPADLLRAVFNSADDDEVEHHGVAWASRQVRELVDAGIPGIHFYTLNSAKATSKLIENLG